MTAFSARISTILVLVATMVAATAAPVAERWQASWINAPGIEPFASGVQHFRKTIELPVKPEHFVVNVTADNRYELFVNGARVGRGPARGDLNHWRYDILDLAPQLRAGRNVLAVVAWNYGENAPETQVTWRSGFLLRAELPAQDALVRTGTSWKAFRDEAFTSLVFTHAAMRGYFTAGPGDRIDGARYPWGWEQPDFDDRNWPAAVMAVGNGRDAGCPRGMRDGLNRWMLEPSPIPQMESVPQRFATVRESSGLTVPGGFPAQAAPVRVPPNSTARLLLDQGVLTTAHPELVVSGGKGAKVLLGYAEALYRKDGSKGNRNEVEGREFVGNHDEFLPDGGRDRLFRPLWWRTFRYVELTVTTAGEALELADLRSVYTGYPFERKAEFHGGDKMLEKILDTGWHTARLCAHETYVDCPYYEQLQYVGDTRIQALVSHLVTGDGRLARNAIELIDASRLPDGFTMSRAPTRQQQVIPPFSLWWIGMVRDYWFYQDDAEFCRDRLPGVRAVLEAFEPWRNPDGTLGVVPWWNFVDWHKDWPGGSPRPGIDGSCAPLDLQLLLGFQWAAALEEGLGSKARAAEDAAEAQRLAAAIRAKYWDNGRKMIADTSARDRFSQHSNALAVIAGVVGGSEAADLMQRVLEDKSLVPCSYYFKFYLHEALLRAGLGDRYLDMLGEWSAMLDRGLTTFAETPDPTRSDCHAWSASPDFEVLRTVLGVESAAPGFSRVVVAPHPGKLPVGWGKVPHPKGWIEVAWERKGDSLGFEVTLPENVTGVFRRAGKEQPLKSGKNTVHLPGN